MTLTARLTLPVLIIVTVGLLATGNLLSSSPWVIGIQVLAVALAIWARTHFRSGQFSVQVEPQPGPLLSAGPYRLIRHPMYAAASLLIGSSVVGHPSPLTVGVSVLVAILVTLRIVAEERFLREHFAEYSAYASATKRIIPFVF